MGTVLKPKFPSPSSFPFLSHYLSLPSTTETHLSSRRAYCVFLPSLLLLCARGSFPIRPGAADTTGSFCCLSLASLAHPRTSGHIAQLVAPSQLVWRRHSKPRVCDCSFSRAQQVFLFSHSPPSLPKALLSETLFVSAVLKPSSHRLLMKPESDCYLWAVHWNRKSFKDAVGITIGYGD
jgi:hypothetical protein